LRPPLDDPTFARHAIGCAVSARAFVHVVGQEAVLGGGAARTHEGNSRRDELAADTPRCHGDGFDSPWTETERSTSVAVKPIPDGYHTATPYLIVKNAANAIDFYKKAFGATELMRMPGPGGRIMHAEIKIGDSPIMLSDESPEMGHRSPQSLGGTPISILLYVKDVDAQFNQAVAAGATAQRPVEDQFYGDRMGTLVDPFGHIWSLGTHKEDVPPQEMEKRFEEFMKKQPQGAA
jgi:PhnB protein